MFNGLVTEETYLNTIKILYENPITNLILNDERSKNFSAKIGNKPKMPTLTTPIPHGTGDPSKGNWERRRNKRHLSGKGSSKIVFVYR